MPARTIGFQTADDLRLEGRLLVPDRPPAGGLAICHPHPQYGGTMSSGPLPDIWREAAARGWAALRFNFRGAGRSEGRYENGVGELKDVAAALDVVAAEVGDRPLAVAGWSFGALVGLAAAVADQRVAVFVGIAPPVTMRHQIELPPLPPVERLAAWRGRALAVCGTEDPFCRPRGLRSWAEQIPGAEVRVLEGEDHFFGSATVRLGRLVADFLGDG